MSLSEFSPDENLMAAARKFILNGRTANAKHRDHVRLLLKSYEDGVRLSNGPDEGRSKDWRIKTYQRANALRTALEPEYVLPPEDDRDKCCREQEA